MMAQYDEELINKFPNLFVRPESEAEREDVERRFDILHGERERLQMLFREIARARFRAAHGSVPDSNDMAVRDAGWHALQDYYSDTYDLTPATYDRDVRLFQESLQAADGTIERLLAEYFPLRLRQCLATSSDVAAQDDPVELLRMCATPGRDISARIRRFEARRKLTLAQLEFELRLNHCAPERLHKDLAHLVRRLKERYFSLGKSEQVTVLGQRDPGDDCRIKMFRVVPRCSPEARVIPTSSLDVLPLDLWFVNTAGREIPIFFEARVKRDPTQKMIRQRLRNHYKIGDHIAATFVYFNEQDLLDAVNRLRRCLVRAPGTVYGQASNLARSGVLDGENEFSAAEYRARKYNFIFLNSPVELRFMLYTDWRNEQVSHGQENHSIYKLRMLVKKLARAEFPPEIFGIDCDAPEIEQELTKFLLSKI